MRTDRSVGDRRASTPASRSTRRHCGAKEHNPRYTTEETQVGLLRASSSDVQLESFKEIEKAVRELQRVKVKSKFIYHHTCPLPLGQEKIAASWHRVERSRSYGDTALVNRLNTWVNPAARFYHRFQAKTTFLNSLSNHWHGNSSCRLLLSNPPCSRVQQVVNTPHPEPATCALVSDMLQDHIHFYTFYIHF